MLRMPHLFILMLAGMVITTPVGVKIALPAGLVLLALISAVFLYKRPEMIRVPSFLTLTCLGVLLFVGLSAFWGINSAAAISATGKFSLLFLAGLLVVIGADQIAGSMGRWVRALPIAGFVATALMVLFILTDLKALAFITGSDAKLVALNKPLGALTLMLPALFYPALFWGRGWRISVFISIAALLFVVLHSESQGALFALLIAAGSLCLPARDTPLARLIMKGVRILIIIGILSAPFAVQVMFAHLASHVGQEGILRAANTAQRMEVWNGIADKIFDRPLLGHGYDAARYMGTYKTDEIYQKSNTILHPHNLALQLWLEFGAIGALWGAAVLATMLRRIESIDIPPLRRLGTIMFASTLGLALISWGMWQTWWMVLIFMLIALFRLVQFAHLRPANNP